MVAIDGTIADQSEDVWNGFIWSRNSERSLCIRLVVVPNTLPPTLRALRIPRSPPLPEYECNALQMASRPAPGSPFLDSLASTTSRHTHPEQRDLSGCFGSGTLRQVRHFHRSVKPSERRRTFVKTIPHHESNKTLATTLRCGASSIISVGVP